MPGELVHVGFGNYVAGDRVVDAQRPASSPVQKLVREGKQRRAILDMTSGRRTRGILFLDTGHIALVAITPDTYRARRAARRRRSR